jgi:hypothetical protein
MPGAQQKSRPKKIGFFFYVFIFTLVSDPAAICYDDLTVHKT